MALQGDAQHAPIATREELRHLAGLPRDVDGTFETPLLPDAPSSTGVAAALACCVVMVPVAP